MLQPEDEFLLKEYEMLRNEIVIKLQQMSHIATGAGIMASGLLSWLYGDRSFHGLKIVCVVPIFIVMLMCYRYFAVRASILRIAGYLSRIEDRLAPSEFGWERNISLPYREEIERWQIIWWLVLMSGTAAACYWRANRI